MNDALKQVEVLGAEVAKLTHHHEDLLERQRTSRDRLRDASSKADTATADAIISGDSSLVDEIQSYLNDAATAEANVARQLLSCDKGIKARNTQIKALMTGYKEQRQVVGRSICVERFPEAEDTLVRSLTEYMAMMKYGVQGVVVEPTIAFRILQNNHLDLRSRINEARDTLEKEIDGAL